MTEIHSFLQNLSLCFVKQNSSNQTNLEDDPVLQQAKLLPEDRSCNRDNHKSYKLIQTCKLIDS